MQLVSAIRLVRQHAYLGWIISLGALGACLMHRVYIEAYGEFLGAGAFMGEEPPNCRSWGSKPRLICKMLDPKSGQTVRIFMCLCGDVSKTARGPYQRIG